MALPKEPVIFFSELPDQGLIDLFIKSPLSTAKELLKHPEQKQRFWQILEKNTANTRLATAYKQVEQILGPAASPPVQPQAAAAPEIPEYKPAEEVIPKETKEIPKNPIGSENVKGVENWMNEIKPGFYQWWQEKYQNTKQGFNSIPQAYAASQNEAAVYQNQFTHGFLEYLSMYKGGLAGFYLSQGAHELLFSALGPVGEALAGLHQKDLQWKMAWMKNPLNANALYYWLNAMPEEQAFKLLYLPAKATWAILAGGGAPLISKVTYMDWEYDPATGPRQVAKTGNFFSPTLKVSQFAHTLGNGLEKLTSLNDFDRERFESYADFTNWKFNNALTNLREAKKDYLSSRIIDDKSARKKAEDNFKQAKGNLHLLLNQHDGSIFRNAFHHTARRLKNTRQDPISYLVALIIGSIYEFTVGLILNSIRVAVGRTFNTIPGVNTLRGQMIEFLTRSKLANIFRISNTTVGQFGRALVSPTSFSSGYLGAGAGGWIANVLGLPTLPGQVIGGSIGYGLGVFYKTSLNLANMGLVDPYGRLTPVGWTKQYEFYRSADVWRLDEGGRAWSKQMIGEKYYGGLKPGPINKFANWLYDRPYARLPINGFVVADLGVKLLGWNPWVAYPSAMFADWAWQTRAAWSKAFLEWLPKTPVGQWIGRQIFSVQSWGVRTFIARPTGAMIGNLAEWGPRPFAQGIYNTWTRFKPYAATAFNPGFWMGFGLAPLLTPTLGGWAWAAGPAIGSATWMAGTRILAAVTGMPYARFASMFNPLAFTGFFIGQLTGLAFFGWSIPFWYTAIWTIGLPVSGMLLQTLAWSLGYSTMSAFLGGVLSSISGGLISIATGTGVFASAFAAWATITSIALVAGLTIFFAYTIYAGFWVPMNQEYFAKPESSNFSIKGNCAEVAPNRYRCCSNFTVTESISSAYNYLTHVTDLNTKDNYLTIDLTVPEDNLSATRDSKELNYRADLSYTYNTFNSQPSLLTSDDYTIRYVQNNPIINSGATTGFDTYLSTPDQIKQNLFDWMSQEQSIVLSMKPFFDILTSLAKEHTGAKHLVAEYEAQLKLFETQKELVDILVNNISSGSLSQALHAAKTYLSRNPLTDPCPEEADCPPEKQGLKSLYDSWEPKITSYITTITNLLAQTDPNLDNFLAQLEQEQAGLKQQIEFLPGIIDQMKEIQKKMTDADAAIINDPNFSFYNFSDEVWRLLSTYFKDVFNENNKFFFIPQGTNYQVCVDTQYTGPTPATPQTVCSSISYTPSVWGPNTAFAKSCTTFTPQ